KRWRGGMSLQHSRSFRCTAPMCIGRGSAFSPPPSRSWPPSSSPTARPRATCANICSSERDLFEKPQHARCGNAIEASLVHWVGEEIVSGTGDDDRAHEKARLFERGEKRGRLRRRINNIVVGAVNQQDARGVLVHGGVVDWGAFEEHLAV